MVPGGPQLVSHCPASRAPHPPTLVTPEGYRSHKGFAHPPFLCGHEPWLGMGHSGPSVDLKVEALGMHPRRKDSCSKGLLLSRGRKGLFAWELSQCLIPFDDGVNPQTRSLTGFNALSYHQLNSLHSHSGEIPTQHLCSHQLRAVAPGSMAPLPACQC